MSEFFEGQVRSLSAKGMGVVDHPEGRVFFVPGTWPGDRGRFRIEKIEKSYGFARMEELLSASDQRVQAPCPHQGHEPGRCGACPWMHGGYSSQLEHKQEIIRHRLQRSQLLDDEDRLKEIWPSPKTLGYRNRAQLKTDGERLGFVSAESHVLAEVKDCLVLTNKNRKTLKQLSARLPEPRWKPKKTSRWNFIDIDESLEIEEAQINQKRDFAQANEDQNKAMQNWLVDKLSQFQESGEWHELFCGDGNFTEKLVEAGATKILAMELAQTALNRLALKNQPQIHCLALDLYKPSEWRSIHRLLPEPKFLFLDPPRDGFAPISKYLQKFPSIQKIIYVSCQLESFARDAKTLKQAGFLLREVQPVDQFPHTPHIELLSHFEKSSIGSN